MCQIEFIVVFFIDIHPIHTWKTNVKPHIKICDALHDFVPFVQFQKSKNTHGGVLLLVKLQVFSFTKSNIPPWVFFTFLKLHKCDALRDFVPLVQCKKREKHPWRSVNFSKVAG